MSYGASYQIVPAALIEQLQSECSQTVESTMPKAGDLVSVNNDSFKSIQAIYKEPDGDMRSILLINLLNKQIEMSVDNKDIES